MGAIPIKTGYLIVIFKKTQDAYDLKESSTKCFEKFKSFIVKKEQIRRIDEGNSIFNSLKNKNIFLCCNKEK